MISLCRISGFCFNSVMVCLWMYRRQAIPGIVGLVKKMIQTIRSSPLMMYELIQLQLTAEQQHQEEIPFADFLKAGSIAAMLDDGDCNGEGHPVSSSSSCCLSSCSSRELLPLPDASSPLASSVPYEPDPNDDNRVDDVHMVDLVEDGSADPAEQIDLRLDGRADSELLWMQSLKADEIIAIAESDEAVIDLLTDELVDETRGKVLKIVRDRPLQLIGYNSTRWNSFFKALRSYLRMHTHVHDVLCKHGHKTMTINDPQDILQLQAIAAVLGQCNDMTMLIQGDKLPTLGVSLFAIMFLKTMLNVDVPPAYLAIGNTWYVWHLLLSSEFRAHQICLTGI